MTGKHSSVIIIVFIFIVIFSCRQKTDSVRLIDAEGFTLSEFSVLENYLPENDSVIKTIELDYSDAIEQGFIIPTARQTSGGYFRFSFSLRNNTGKAKSFSYKIYYQNESYKFPEIDSLTGKMHEFAQENFYGSWDDSSYQFKTTYEIPADGKFHSVKDSFRITGNPRNEIECYENGLNKRSCRNPRVGEYKFYLALTHADSSSLNAIPPYIKNICLKNGDQFNSPFFYLLYGEGKRSGSLITVAAENILKVIARPDLGSGIYIKGGHFDHDTVLAYSTPSCGFDTALQRKAAFAQFIHYIDASTSLDNIPVVKDVTGDGYSKREYNWNRSFMRKEELISTSPKTADVPCQTVFSDAVNRKIIIRNPRTSPGRWRKENVGIISRHGMSYGKIRVKVKLTELLNKDNMWNGITNAIWLINQEGGDETWNMRRACRKEGYMATYWGGPKDKRVPQVSYSEIDFEILKTPSYCPDQIFPPVYKLPSPNRYDESSWNVPWPEEITRHDGDITVACTNWDMACWEPEDFGVGCHTISYQGQSFESHRWDHWYRALTQKTYANDDSLFAGPYYYFEIDWRPAEIIWRIGPEPDRMRVVGYMNDKITSIPDNQMVLIVTQEFHNTAWWPGSPYQQNNIPFPANDIQGEILEVVME
jgi:hypothetical protein